jgi:hypothetical protein
MNGWTWSSLTTSMSWWTGLYLKRMLWKRPRETRRGTLVLLRVVELTKIFALWRRMFLTRPSNLQLDVGWWSHHKANFQGTSNSVTLSSRLPNPIHPHATPVNVVVIIVDSRGTI